MKIGKQEKKKPNYKIYQNEYQNPFPNSNKTSYANTNKSHLLSNKISSSGYKDITPKLMNNSVYKKNYIYKSKKPVNNSSIDNRYHHEEAQLAQKINNFPYNNNDINNKNLKFSLQHEKRHNKERKSIERKNIEKKNIESKATNQIDNDIGNEQRKFNLTNYTKNNVRIFNISRKGEDKSKNDLEKKNQNQNIFFNNVINKNNNNNQKIPKKPDKNKNINISENSQINSNVLNNSNNINNSINSNKFLKLANGINFYNINIDKKKSLEIKEKENPEDKFDFSSINLDSFPETYFCDKCHENITININPDLFTISTLCKNGHNLDNIPIKEFFSKIKKDASCSKCRTNVSQQNLFFCISCGVLICKKCEKRYHSTHNKIPLLQKNFICLLHKKTFSSFCNKCNKNICIDCVLKEHIQHKKDIIYFEKIIPKEQDIKIWKKNLEKIKYDKEKFNKDVDEFIKELNHKKNEFNQNYENYIQIQNDIVNKLNNKEILNYENIINTNKVLKYNKNLFDNYLKIGNNFNKKGKFLINLFYKEEVESPIYKIKKEIKYFEIIKNKNINIKKNEIQKEIDFNIIKSNNNNKNKNKINIICSENIIFINNSMGNKNNKNKKNEKSKNQGELQKNLRNIDNNIEGKNSIIKPKIKILEKIENCEKKLENKDIRCITSFALLRNNRIVFTFKGGFIKFYEFIKNPQNQIELKELLTLEEEEYCFNYAIELYDYNIAACSEDGTLKIIKLFFDEKPKNPDKKHEIIQVILEVNKDPIYIIKEIQNHNLILGCWKNILVYQKAIQYELIHKIKIQDYNFCIFEITPNVIIASHSETKTLTGHDFNTYEFYTIKNIESNENNNIIKTYNNNKNIILVGCNNGISIVSILKKALIKKIVLNEIISSICPIQMEVNFGDKNGNKKIFGILLGAKRKIYGEKVNYAYSMLQLGFNVEKEGIIDDEEDGKGIEYKTISRKDRIHYYDVTNLQNSFFDKNKESLTMIENKEQQWIFTSGNEDKLFEIWKFE